eukprot:CAMPEP_0174261104 /NCGR_PEP_ID=MMETSP0439-20130205/11233_1 /TAXON_ID=0 /ORGANISM="Stereomyxa ramosa, Strain Chinc5" /LENGTH=187 /DNA_ID=CAMNT_0015345525 /DNA_START=51 /DNA_END=614 /DNA_ORIENTATION=+
MKPTFQLVLIVLFGVFALYGAVEVKKVVEGSANGVYTIAVGYKSSGTGNAKDILISDSLPSTLELVSGELVAKSPDATSEWIWHRYQVKATGVKFTLKEQEVEVVLPPATITYRDAGNRQNTVKTDETTLVTRFTLIPAFNILPVKYDLTPVVLFFTVLLPLIGAYYGTSRYHKKAAASKKKGKKTN